MEDNTEQSQARYLVPEVRQYSQAKQMDAQRCGPAD
jgi:hypothetical protein